MGWSLFELILPAFCGRAIQFPPVPYFSIYALSFESSSGDHGPFFTFALSQQGALPIPPFVWSLSLLSVSLSLSLSLLPSFLLSLSSLLSISLYFRGTKGLRTLCGAAAFY